jgi:hypothetical protein
MSTRACYTFRDENGDEYHVYKHHDGYPTGAAGFITAALAHAWPLPRFEADDFAAAFVAANKSNHGGGVRLMHSGKIQEVVSSDIEYRYEVTPKGKSLEVKGYETRYFDKPDETLIFTCDIADLAKAAETAEAG